MNEQSSFENYMDRLHISVSFNATNHLMQLIGYRQRVAEELLKNSMPESKSQLIDIFEDVNNQIRKVLGL